MVLGAKCFTSKGTTVPLRRWERFVTLRGMYDDWVKRKVTCRAIAFALSRALRDLIEVRTQCGHIRCRNTIVGDLGLVTLFGESCLGRARRC